MTNLTKVQKEVIEIMKANPSYFIRTTPYEHIQELMDGVAYDGTNWPFRKFLYKSTVRVLTEKGYLIPMSDAKYPLMKLKESEVSND